MRIAAVLDAVPAPSFQNYTSGFGRVGTSYYFKVKDPASRLELGGRETSGYPGSEASESVVARALAIFSTYLLGRFWTRT